MQIVFQRTFTKQYEKLPLKIRSQFDERLLLWLDSPEDARLRVHSLKGKYHGYWSMRRRSGYFCSHRNTQLTLWIGQKEVRALLIPPYISWLV
jgi:hypothetical protein